MTHPTRIPPTRDAPPFPPPPADHAFDAASHAEQTLRSTAADIAASMLDDCSGTPAGIAARLIELAEPIADWIRDGSRP